MHDLKVWVGVEADGSSSSTTPGKISGQLDEMSRVAKVQQCALLSPVLLLTWVSRFTSGLTPPILEENLLGFSGWLFTGWLSFLSPNHQCQSTESSV